MIKIIKWLWKNNHFSVVLPYLWGIETIWWLTRIWWLILYYLIYEELKPSNITSYNSFNSFVLPYLWGIETWTYNWIEHVLTRLVLPYLWGIETLFRSWIFFFGDAGITLSMRNWNSSWSANCDDSKYSSVLPYLCGIETFYICL